MERIIFDILRSPDQRESFLIMWGCGWEKCHDVRFARTLRTLKTLKILGKKPLCSVNCTRQQKME
jgi:hypothetical protein